MEGVRIYYKDKLNDYLIRQSSEDSQIRYEAIEKNFPYC